MQAIAAVQEKLLRLNSATFNHVSTGHIVNLVSNDVRRFDEFGPFWVFGWAGPLEALAVLVMIAMEMGWWPAIAGVSTLLLVIPVQVKLAGRIANLRTRSAGRTDERVRITGMNPRPAAAIAFHDCMHSIYVCLLVQDTPVSAHRACFLGDSPRCSQFACNRVCARGIHHCVRIHRHDVT